MKKLVLTIPLILILSLVFLIVISTGVVGVGSTLKNYNFSTDHTNKWAYGTNFYSCSTPQLPYPTMDLSIQDETTASNLDTSNNQRVFAEGTASGWAGFYFLTDISDISTSDKNITKLNFTGEIYNPWTS